MKTLAEIIKVLVSLLFWSVALPLSLLTEAALLLVEKLDSHGGAVAATAAPR